MWIRLVSFIFCWTQILTLIFCSSCSTASKPPVRPNLLFIDDIWPALYPLQPPSNLTPTSIPKSVLWVFPSRSNHSIPLWNYHYQAPSPAAYFLSLHGNRVSIVCPECPPISLYMMFLPYEHLPPPSVGHPYPPLPLPPPQWPPGGSFIRHAKELVHKLRI